MPKLKRFELIQQEIDNLQHRISEETPERGYTPPLHQQVAFRTLPLSENTLRGLEGSAKKSFSTMTAIQSACIPHALAGRDILGAARTGSGKTLAFVIPLLEKLYREKYAPSDGCGAIVLSPTRELAVQIFDVLRQVGAYHALTAGLLVGGKKEFNLEQQHVGRSNILVATPGRLLQHLEQTPDLDVTHLQMLVLDEADRILDMGFRTQITRILDYLPTERQTMLFSATQTRKVSDLATLSLKQPEYLGVHDNEKSSTPESLQQSLVVVPLEHKLNAIYSFVKSHLKCKSIVFLASCSQVRHAWELFCALQPGIPVMALHGKLVQERRTKIYFEYLQKPHAVLFATDVAARGLDFPNVDWVLQADAPEDKDMYIHRAGRTARYKAGGNALLMVTPSEEVGFMSMLTNAKIPIKKLSINPTKTVLVTQKAAALVASRPQLNELAKKAFKSYVRSIHLMPNKEIFGSAIDMPLAEYAASLGLSATPKLGFLKRAPDREELREKKNVNHKLHRLKEQIKNEKLAKKLAKLGQNQSAIKSSPEKEEDDLMVVKRKHNPDSDDDEKLPAIDVGAVSKSRHAKKIRIDGGTGENKRVKFDDDGEEVGTVLDAALSNERVRRDNLESNHDDYMRKVRERLAATKDLDAADAKERIRDKHRKKRMQEKGELDEDEKVVLGNEDSDNEDGSVVVDERGDSDDDETDIKAQEELALAMIRGS
jgi:ATP-dependent RNA helicase DDX10/DBP4